MSLMRKITTKETREYTDNNISIQKLMVQTASVVHARKVLSVRPRVDGQAGYLS